ncbi:MAG: dihydropteroate synthase [Thermoplasmata archaeon]|nr:MAG: dihydropteroate synthase [Thermoplasmata archaeon]
MVAHLRIIDDAKKEMKRIGVAEGGMNIMIPKCSHYCIKIYDVHPQDAIIMKQEMLSIGGDVAISSDTLPPSSKKTDVLLMGTHSQISILSKKLERHYERLHMIGKEVMDVVRNVNKKHELKIGKRRVKLGEKTLIMGILNVTPDSFYDGGKYNVMEKAIERAYEMEREGADMIDIGGESTRPGAEAVPIEKEMKRVIPVIEEIANKIKIPISIDTYKAKVAEKAIEKGATMVNDITALRGDEKMAEVVADYDVPICIMHMKGTPQTMQKSPYYKDIMEDIIKFLHQRAKYAISRGIAEENIILDPGIGFGKRTGKIEDNCEIIARLTELKSLGFPIMIGISRKTFIGNICNTQPEERLEGSLGAEAIAIANGADILRVHDVKETKKMSLVVDKILKFGR